MADVEKDIHEDENQSTCLSIVKMTMFNLNKILDVVISSNFEFNYSVETDQLESVLSIISDVGYEENGDIVESSY